MVFRIDLTVNKSNDKTKTNNEIILSTNSAGVAKA